MGVIQTIKQVSTRSIDCGGRLTVTLGLTAEPDILSHPADLVLVLDRSRSMRCGPLCHMKAGAERLIALVTASTGGTAGKFLGGGSRMAVVSFECTAQVHTALTDRVPTLLESVECLTAQGATNHDAGFRAALGLFEPDSPNEKILILFTDGQTTAGPDPMPVVEELKAAGVSIYCVGLNAPEEVLNRWAGEPAEHHVAVAPTAEELERVFAEIAGEVVRPGASQVSIEEIVSPDFTITRMDRPTHGRARRTGANTLLWEMDAVGTVAETALLRFEIMHVGRTGGEKAVNYGVRYRDRAGTELTFPSPTVEVDCTRPPQPCTDCCPDPVRVNLCGCQQNACVEVCDVTPDGLGRVVNVAVTLRSICPGKRVAAAVLLTELGPCGQEFSRGMQTFTVPAHPGPGCQDVRVPCVRFIVPEDLNLTHGCDWDSVCSPREFHVRVMANYIDTDFLCCESVGTKL